MAKKPRAPRTTPPNCAKGTSCGRGCISAKKERTDALVGTAASKPAPKGDRVTGSDKNKSGSAANSRGGVELSAAIIDSLKTKVKAHNEKSDRRVNLGMLKAVYRRGAGAYSTSHDPKMSRGAWAMARVNAFLYLVRTGKPKNPNYTTDNDLLPKTVRRDRGEPKNCIKSTTCGDGCISNDKTCQIDQNTPQGQQSMKALGSLMETAGQLTKKALESEAVGKVKKLASDKEKVLTEGAVVAAGLVGGTLAGPIAGSLASASMRAVITVGKKLYAKITQAKAKAAASNGKGLMKIATQVGAEFISDLKSPKFQKQLEKSYVNAIVRGAISATVSTLVPIPLVGNAVAMKTAGAGGKLAERAIRAIKKKRSKNAE